MDGLKRLKGTGQRTTVGNGKREQVSHRGELTGVIGSYRGGVIGRAIGEELNGGLKCLNAWMFNKEPRRQGVKARRQGARAPRHQGTKAHFSRVTWTRSGGSSGCGAWSKCL